jgi:hypothetical protein
MGKHIVSIAADGTLTIEGTGFKGKACELPPAFLSALGAVSGSKKKPEYFVSEGSTVNQGR